MPRKDGRACPVGAVDRVIRGLAVLPEADPSLLSSETVSLAAFSMLMMERGIPSSIEHGQLAGDVPGKQSSGCVTLRVTRAAVPFEEAGASTSLFPSPPGGLAKTFEREIARNGAVTRQLVEFFTAASLAFKRRDAFLVYQSVRRWLERSTSRD